MLRASLGRKAAYRPRSLQTPPMVRLVMYSYVEVIHHGAEICLLRDLYAGRTGDTAV